MKQFWTILIFYCPFFAFTKDATDTGSDTAFCGDTRVIFKSRCSNDSLQRISFVHVHENETTAVEAMARLLDTINKGCFVSWQCRQQRFVDFKLDGITYRFDPNRIYTAAGINATLRSNNGVYSKPATSAVKKVADRFIKNYVDSNLLVIALHNNTNRGGLSINSYKKGGVFSRDAKQVFMNPKQDVDDFFYTTDVACFNFLKSKDFNVILQDNAGMKDDGSLSVYCATKRIPYINIEAQDGHLKQQVQMLTAVSELISQISK